MQASPRELNPVHGTLAALVAGAAAGAAILAPRWGGPPTAVEVVQGTAASVRSAAELQALAIALLVVVPGTLLPVVRRNGWFASCAGAALAMGLAGLLVTGGLPPVACGAGAALAGLAVAPLLRERGLLSLVVVPLLAPLPALLCVRTQLQLADASQLVGRVQARAPLFGSVVLELPVECTIAEARAFALALQPPHRQEAVGTFWVVEGSVHARWVQQLGLPVLRVRGAGAELSGPDRQAALAYPGKARVTAGWETRGDGARVLRVHAPELAGGTLALFSWAGVREDRLGADGLATVDSVSLLPSTGGQGPMPAGARIQGLAVSPTTADVYGWFDVPMP